MKISHLIAIAAFCNTVAYADAMGMAGIQSPNRLVLEIQNNGGMSNELQYFKQRSSVIINLEGKSCRLPVK